MTRPSLHSCPFVHRSGTTGNRWDSASLLHVNPSVEAAFIAGGVSLISLAGTVVVAVSGFGNTRRVSGETIAAAADNAHRDRLWAAQAAAYVDTIVDVQWQQARRLRQLIYIATGDPLPADKPPVDWNELQGRLFAYASPAVLVALKAASDAGLEARARYRNWHDMILREVDTNLAGGPGTPVDITATPAVLAAAQAVTPAVQFANDKDDTLIEVIRADLHRRPGETPLPTVFPARQEVGG